MDSTRLPSPRPGGSVESKRNPETTVVLPGWTDVTSLFTNACDRLPLGNMVHIPGYSMMDTMGSIEVMEPRTDNGMAPAVDQLLPPEEKTEVVWFDPNRFAREYTPRDVVFILDRLLASQVGFHQASPLSVTVYLCLWLQEPHSKFTAAIAQPALTDHRDQHALLLALAAACSATLASVNLAYQEFSRYNVMEMEDFAADKAGLTILDSSLTPSSAIQGLQRAQQRLRQYATDAHFGLQAVRSIQVRLSLLERLVSLQALVSNMPANILDIYERFDQEASAFRDALAQLTPSSSSADAQNEVWSLTSPNLCEAPSAIAANTFDVWTYRRLIAPVPVRPRVLPSPSDTTTFCSILADQLQDVVSCLLLPGDPNQVSDADGSRGYPTWVERLTHAPLALSASGASLMEIPGYARSLHMAALCCTSQGYAINATRTLDWFADSFLTFAAGVTIGDLGVLIQALEWEDNQFSLNLGEDSSFPSYPGNNAYTPNWTPARPAPAPALQQPLAPRLRDILARLPGLLIADLTFLGQNPSQAHRKISNSKDLVRLSNTVSDIAECITQYAPSAREKVPMLQRIQLAILGFTQLAALQVPLLGLQLELYPPSRAESDSPSGPACAVWLASILAQTRAETLEQLVRFWPETPEVVDQEQYIRPDTTSLERERHLMLALASFLQACYLLTYAPVPAPEGTKVQPIKAMNPDVRAGLLEHRFRWLKDPLLSVALGFEQENVIERYESRCYRAASLATAMPSLVEAVALHLNDAREHAQLAGSLGAMGNLETDWGVLATLAHGRDALAHSLIQHTVTLLARVQGTNFVAASDCTVPAVTWKPGTWVPTLTTSSA